MAGGDSAGGSLELARLIDKCGGAILADLKRYHGVNLHDVLVPGSGLTARMVVEYIRHLPHDSATFAELQGGSEFVGWGVEQYLLASVVDSVRENTYAFVSANSQKSKPKAPEPVPRPGRAKKKNNLFAVMASKRLRANRRIKEGADGD